MVAKQFALLADIRTDNPAKIQAALIELVGVDAMLRTDRGFWIRTTMVGQSASELNRVFLSALRRLEAKATVRAEWTHGNTTERFMDFDPHERRKPTSEESAS